MTHERHVLGLSGGRDSAALAIYMRQHRPELDIEYFFTDTGKELPEVYEFLNTLAGYLGKPIISLNPDRDFDFWLKQYGHFLPSPRTRWCTKQLKLKPLEQWLREDLDAGVIVHSYVAIRADEPSREGYQSARDGMLVHFPLREAGIDRKGVEDILLKSGVGEPEYYKWRSRSGCTFCFFQQKVEWIRLAERHPEAFKEAVDYEKTAQSHGAPFTWSHGESLLELLERREDILMDHETRQRRIEAKRRRNPLAALTDSYDSPMGVVEESSCIICHK